MQRCISLGRKLFLFKRFRVFLSFSAALFSLLPLLATPPTSAAPQPPPANLKESVAEPAASYTWNIQAVDAPKRFNQMDDSSLRLDADGHPHIAYGGNHLYYAWHDGTDWHYETVDSANEVGSYASLALDADNNPHISYYDTANRDLKYAQWTGSAWTIEMVDGEAGDDGQFSSLALDPAGNPHITYCVTRPVYNDCVFLRYAHWDGSSWVIETVDERAAYSSLVIDADGNPHISSCNVFAMLGVFAFCKGLKYTRWTGSEWEIEIVDSGDAVGVETSLALDAEGNPHISYFGDDGIKYAYWTGTAWSVETVAGGGRDPSLALDLDGYPHISYYIGSIKDSELRYARWTGSAWTTETVDIAGNSGFFSSLVLDAAGNPHISYCDIVPGQEDCIDLKYAQWTGSNWSIEAVDAAEDFGRYSSLALDADGNPHISYQAGYPRYGLQYAHRTGSDWAIETVDSAEGAGSFTSLALDAAGNPHISYHDYYYDSKFKDTLKYAHWTGSDWAIETVDSSGIMGEGEDTSLALDAAGNPHISYFDWTADELKYARWNGSAWSIETVDSHGGEFASLALDTDDNPHIAYSSGKPGYRLKYARWTGTNWIIKTVNQGKSLYTSLALDETDQPHISYCVATGVAGHFLDCDELDYSSWTGHEWLSETVDSQRGVGHFPSLVLDRASNPHISYYNARTGNLKYARWTGSRWATEIVDSAGQVGAYPSLALDRAGNPHMSYYDATNYNLKYAVGVPNCADAPATPFLSAPKDGRMLDHRRARLNWTNSACATYYQVVVKKESPQGDLVDSDNDLPKSKYKTKVLVRGNTYFWRVRACGDGGCSDWTDYRHFTIRASTSGS